MPLPPITLANPVVSALLSSVTVFAPLRTNTSMFDTLANAASVTVPAVVIVSVSWPLVPSMSSLASCAAFRTIILSLPNPPTNVSLPPRVAMKSMLLEERLASMSSLPVPTTIVRALSKFAPSV